MHSEQQIDFPYKLLEGVTLKGKLHTDIYYVDQMPSDEALQHYKNSFVMTVSNSKLSIYYVDQAGHKEPANVEDSKLKELIVKEMAKLEASDFLYIPQSVIQDERDLFKIIDEYKSAANSAFVLHGNNLYLVDKINRQYQFLQKFDKDNLSLVDSALHEKVLTSIYSEMINEKNKIVHASLANEQNKDQKSALISLLDKNSRNKIEPINIDKIPIDNYFSSDAFNAFKTALSAHIPEVNKQFYMYEAEVDPALYQPQRGDFIEQFETIKEINAKKLLDSLEESVNKFTKNIPSHLEQAKRDIRRKITSPSFWARTIGFVAGAATPHLKSDPHYLIEERMESAKDTFKDQHEKGVVEPRAERAYALAENIPTLLMQGGKLEHKLEDDIGHPYDIMKIWIVSDVEPDVIKQRRGINIQLGRHFACASEREAYDLVAEKIKENKSVCERDLAADTICYPAFKGDEKHDNQLQLHLNELDLKLNEQISNYNRLVRRQREYVSDYNELSADKSPPIPVPMKKKSDIRMNEYVHFRQKEKIHEQIIMVRSCINEHKLDKSSSNAAELALNKELQQLYNLCQTYIAQHPYKDVNKDPVFNLLHMLEEKKAVLENIEKARQSTDNVPESPDVIKPREP